MTASKRARKPIGKRAPARRSPTPRGVGREEGAPGKGAQAASLDGPFNRDGYLRGLIRDVSDFPRPGMQSKDLTALLADPRALRVALSALVDRTLGRGIDVVVGIEAQGFVFGALLAHQLNAGFVQVRKLGRLAGATDRVAYSLGYGLNELEIQRDAELDGLRALIVDDVLASGATALAAAELVQRQGASVMGFCFVVELLDRNGRQGLAPTPVYSVVGYD